MTAIVGYVDSGTRDVWMGADSALTWNWSLQSVVKADPKVFRNGPLLIGLCGEPRVAQLLRWKLTLADCDPRKTLEEWVATTFIDAVRTVLKAGGVAMRKNEREETESAFMVGYRGRLFVIGSDYQYYENPLGFLAIGSGGDLGMGALDVLVRQRPQAIAVPAERLVTSALIAAARWNAAVRPPFVIHRLAYSEAEEGPPLAEPLSVAETELNHQASGVSP